MTAENVIEIIEALLPPSEKSRLIKLLEDDAELEQDVLDGGEKPVLNREVMKRLRDNRFKNIS